MKHENRRNQILFNTTALQLSQQECIVMEAPPKSAAVTQEGQRSSREEVSELTDRQRAVMCVFVCQRSGK